MLVMLSCGPSSNQITKTISKQIDNVDFFSYFSVNEFISQSKLRHLAFDRLVFSSKFISSDGDMSILCDYIRKELNSTEIVMILSKNQKSLEEVFKAYFDSPMYTVMYLDSPTTMHMVDAVKLPIADVKARYYSFDKPSDNGVEKKSSRLGVFKGGKKNKSPNSENQNSSVNTSQNSENIGNFDVNSVPNSSIPNTAQSYSNNTNSSVDFNSPNYNVLQNQNSSMNGSISNENKNQDTENSPSSFDDLDLSIGDYGSQHSDSGFVGDDDLDELNRFAQSQNVQVSQYGEAQNDVPQNQNNANTLNSGQPHQNYTPVSPYSEVSVENPLNQGTQIPSSQDFPIGGEPQNSVGVVSQNTTPLVNDVTDMNSQTSYNIKPNLAEPVDTVHKDSLVLGSINIVTGLQGSGVSAYIANSATRLAREGKTVLIVDLDYNSNGILSFLDVRSFYEKGCNCGIDRKRIYSEDSIDILSNGYGMAIETDVSNFLGKSALNRYDIVIVDCPLDCLSIIPDRVFCDSNVVICCISDISKLTEPSAKLYDRGIVSLKKEKHISTNCKIANKHIKSNDIDILKNLVLFPNGCWLENK